MQQREEDLPWKSNGKRTDRLRNMIQQGEEDLPEECGRARAARLKDVMQWNKEALSEESLGSWHSKRVWQRSIWWIAECYTAGARVLLKSLVEKQLKDCKSRVERGGSLSRRVWSRRTWKTAECHTGKRRPSRRDSDRAEGLQNTFSEGGERSSRGVRLRLSSRITESENIRLQLGEDLLKEGLQTVLQLGGEGLPN